MSINDLQLNSARKPGTGDLTAAINNNYIISNFEGQPTIFTTNGKEVALYATYPHSSTVSFCIQLNFSANIKQGRYEFHPNNLPVPPSFSYTEGGHTKGYNSDKGAGHLEISEFDINEGTFKASFNFTFTDFDTNRRHQVVGNIDVSDLEHIEE
ncbi:hypothetical protein PHLH6_46910 [Pseudomonas sp. Seg1]|uniref:hypothetical protein n=1 Tax=unclassified Pseudomonas TaxID=196821 RepID=UPI000CD1A79B|nr:MULTISPECIES: hypothetical protein [unclassified Pseudomonas]POA47511.1 hypothetical protein C1893_15135 [Pseudomonas sp. MPR-ANC1]BBP72687.1 hypothetical protein PHLH6_46910 [Pseudomonas sp. Seg1]